MLLGWILHLATTCNMPTVWWQQTFNLIITHRYWLFEIKSHTIAVPVLLLHWHKKISQLAQHNHVYLSIECAMLHIFITKPSNSIEVYSIQLSWIGRKTLAIAFRNSYAYVLLINDDLISFLARTVRGNSIRNSFRSQCKLYTQRKVSINKLQWKTLNKEHAWQIEYGFSVTVPMTHVQKKKMEFNEIVIHFIITLTFWRFDDLCAARMIFSLEFSV